MKKPGDGRERPTVVTSLRFDAEVLRALRVYAAASDRKQGDILEEALREYFKTHPVPKISL